MDRRLPDSVATVLEVQLLHQEAEKLVAAYSDAPRRGAKPKAVAAPSEDLAAILGDTKLTAASLEATAAWLRDQQKGPVVHIILPVLPQPDLRQRLVAWLRNNLRPDLLVSFERNSSLAGGFALRTGSTIFDFSFRRKLLDGTKAMHEVLAKVLKTPDAKQAIGTDEAKSV